MRPLPLQSQCLASSYEGGYPATALCRAAVQTLVDVMEACWRSGHETAVKSLLLPGLDPKRPVGPESTPLCIMVGLLPAWVAFHGSHTWDVFTAHAPPPG